MTFKRIGKIESEVILCNDAVYRREQWATMVVWLRQRTTSGCEWTSFDSFPVNREKHLELEEKYRKYIKLNSLEAA